MRRKKRGKLTPSQSSIVLHLAPILAARNIMHPSAFLIRAGINNFSANKMLQGKAVQINFKQLTALCVSLNCTPNDLFALRAMELPAFHQLHTLQTIDAVAINPQQLYQTMSLKEIQGMVNTTNEQGNG